MRRAVALVAALSLGSCSFAVKHPAITAGLAGGVLAGGLCELNVSSKTSSQEACGLTTAGAGIGLAAIVLLATWLGGDGHTILVGDPDEPLPQKPLAPDPVPGPPGATTPDPVPPGPAPAAPPAPPASPAEPTAAPPADAQ